MTRGLLIVAFVNSCALFAVKKTLKCFNGRKERLMLIMLSLSEQGLSSAVSGIPSFVLAIIV